MTHDEDIQIPDRLGADLRRLHAGPAASRSLHERVMAEARRRLAPRPLVLRPATWAAAAAVVAVGLTTWMLLPRAAAPVFAREDVDASGRVDMLDAFRIARAVDRGLPTDAEWDLNEDGVVDRADAEVAAAASVRLEGESS